MELSVIIPVFREKPGIEQTLARLLALDISIPFEVILVDGEKARTTLAYVKTLGLDTRVRLLSAPKGRGPQMNAGAAAAKGQLLFFLHADSWLDQQGMDQMVCAWQGRTSNDFCGAFDLVIDAAGFGFRVVEKTASLRSRLTRIPYGDQGIFMSRSLFDTLGRFPEIPLMEDVALMQKVKARGIHPWFLDGGIRTSARRWHRHGILGATLRNWLLISLYLLGISPHRLARLY